MHMYVCVCVCVLCAPPLELLNQLGFLKQGMNITQFEGTLQYLQISYNQ